MSDRSMNAFLNEAFRTPAKIIILAHDGELFSVSTDGKVRMISGLPEEARDATTGERAAVLDKAQRILGGRK